MISTKLLLVVATIWTAGAFGGLYDNYQVVRVVPQTERALKVLHDMQRNAATMGIEFWKKPSLVGRFADLTFPASVARFVHIKLSAAGLKPRMIHLDLQKVIDAEATQILRQAPFQAGDNVKAFDIAKYHSFDEINTFLNTVAQQYSTIASVFSIGKSHEGRDMKVIKIGVPGSGKKSYWIDGGIHAREWITVTTATWIINNLTTLYASGDAGTVSLLRSIDFYILPVLNPDGYEFTRSTNRMWRKTRSGPVLGCYGVDANRNFDDHWDEEGASDNPCSEEYAGKKPFTEIEIVNMKNWILANKASLGAYINLHSYSEDWLLLYAYKKGAYPPDYTEHKNAADQGARALQAVHGTKYTVGSPPDILYAASGGTYDWVRDAAGVKWAYALELRPGENNPNGFILPASEIIPTGEETWAGLKSIAMTMLSTN